MSTIPEHSAGEPEGSTGSLSNGKAQVGDTIGASSTVSPESFNKQPEVIVEPPSQGSSRLWRSRQPSTNSEFEYMFPHHHPDSKVPSALTYTSFGDGDTTASVTAFGQIMQITRFLGVGHSGFVCVDRPYVPEPYTVKGRARKLMDLSTSTDGIGLSFDQTLPSELSELFQEKPTMEFVHDRWPRFTTKTTNVISTMQSFIRDSTVFSMWTCQSIHDTIPMTACQFFNADQLIRELEFLKKKHTFNEATRETPDAYQVVEGHDQESLIIAHSSSQQEGISCGIGLVVTFYVNGKRQKIRKDEQYEKPHLFQVGLGKMPKIQKTQSFEVTVAYKLQRLPQDFKENFDNVSVPQYSRFDEVLMAYPYAPLEFSPFAGVDFIVRRNLEHILSVCSIPVALNEDSDENVVALTCGDMSGHRLLNRASFFMFQFLLSVLRYLESVFPDQTRQYDDFSKGTARTAIEMEAASFLRKRIRNTCIGHLNWLFYKASKPGNSFAANYWATGESINDLQSGGMLGEESLTDTPLQIIKLSDFVAVMEENKEGSWGRTTIPRLVELIPHWLPALEAADKRRSSVFPQPGTQKYHLEDHVWIWRALKSIEIMGLGSHLKATGLDDEQPSRTIITKENHVSHSEPRKPLSRDFSAAVFQRKVLKKFTTEDTVSRRKMIALSRTQAKARFMLHSADTGLFYSSNLPFLSGAGSFWKTTTEIQKLHEENQDFSWSDPLHYALVLVVSRLGHQINSRSAEETLREAEGILLSISSSNGLFPGQIDTVTKEPQLFRDKEDRDSYWNTSFETLNAFWAFPNKDSSVAVYRSVLKHSDQVDSDATLASSFHSDNPLLRRNNHDISRSFHSSTRNDQTGIVELSDEWLYSYPDFLDFDPCIRDQLASHGVLSRSKQNESSLSLAFHDDLLKGIVLDIPKTMSKSKRRKNRASRQTPEGHPVLCTNQGIYEKLDGWRSAQTAKKRFVWLPHVDEATAFICGMASPVSERVLLSSFFDRHNRREMFLFDNAAAASNTWQTEFHLSWYQLHDKCQASDCEDISFLGAEKKIGRGTVGFLFTGDFFDRYWTCRVLEHRPETGNEFESGQVVGGDIQNDEMLRLSSRFEDLIKPTGLFTPMDIEKNPWRQRKVLELLLFDLMLRQASMRYEEMLKEIIKHLIQLLSPSQSDSHRPSSTSDVWNAFLSSNMSNHTYTSFSRDWPRIQCTLQILEDDLKRILATIALWKTREKDREPETPRWTRNDEQKYRSAITRLLISNIEKVRELEQHLANIQSLSTYLTILVESTRNVLSFKSSENVRFFTLVTSIFLPLGFATAIFSMNGLPGGSELTGWAILAAVCVCVTFIALYFKGLEEHVFKPVHGRMKEAINREGVQKTRNVRVGLDDGDSNAAQRSQTNNTELFLRNRPRLKWGNKGTGDLESGFNG